MSEWPLQLPPLHWHPAISTRSQFLGPASGGAGSLASTAWPTANLAIFVPVLIPSLMTVAQLWVVNGATASGNLDMGLYDLAGTRLVSSGSTAQAGTAVLQILNVTDTQVGPGIYYIALAMDGTTGTTWKSAQTLVAYCALIGIAQMASAFALPAVATFASATNAYIPTVGLTDRSVF